MFLSQFKFTFAFVSVLLDNELLEEMIQISHGIDVNINSLELIKSIFCLVFPDISTPNYYILYF